MRTLISSTGHPETLQRLLHAVERRGLRVFATFDHGAAAREVGMELPDEVVVVFGNPRAGTLLMQRDARIGIELPLRVLVWNDAARTVLGFDDPRDLSQRYDVAAQAATLDAMATLLEEIAREAAAE